MISFPIITIWNFTNDDERPPLHCKKRHCKPKATPNHSQVPICVPSDPDKCTSYNILSRAALLQLDTMINTSAYR